MPEYSVGDTVTLKDDGQIYRVIGVRSEDKMILYDLEQGDGRATVKLSVLLSQIEKPKLYTPKQPPVVIYKKRP